jgi:hypothetical protein
VTDDVKIYDLFKKFKVLSALTDEDFLNALVGTGEKVEIKSQSEIRREKMENLKRLDKEKIATKIQERINKNRLREERLAARSNELGNKILRGGDNESEEEIALNELLDEMWWDNGDEGIYETIFNSSKFDITPVLIEEEFNEIFNTRIHIRYGDAYGSSHTTFLDIDEEDATGININASSPKKFVESLQVALNAEEMQRAKTAGIFPTRSLIQKSPAKSSPSSSGKSAKSSSKRTTKGLSRKTVRDGLFPSGTMVSNSIHKRFGGKNKTVKKQEK